MPFSGMICDISEEAFCLNSSLFKMSSLDILPDIDAMILEIRINQKQLKINI
jgi:hypothetical protein